MASLNSDDTTPILTQDEENENQTQKANLTCWLLLHFCQPIVWRNLAVHKLKENENQTQKANPTCSLLLHFCQPIVWRNLAVHLPKFLILIFQLTKVVLITIMLIEYGHDWEFFNKIVNRGQTTLRNIFMEKWDASWETLPYPPAHGEFAVYERKDLTERINYAVEQYFNLQSEAIRNYSYPKEEDLTLSMQYFEIGRFENDPSADLAIKEIDFQPDKGLTLLDGKYIYNITKEFEFHNISRPLKRLLLLKLAFTLNSVQVLRKEQKALCLNIHCSLMFDDTDNNGQVIQSLKTKTSKVRCKKINSQVTDWDLHRIGVCFAIAVYVFCGVGILYSLLSISLGWYLTMKTYEKEDNKKEPGETTGWLRHFSVFFKFWDIISLGSDVFTIYGTKLSVQQKAVIDIDLLDSTTVWLGVGCLLAWFSILQYCRFHSKFHLLFTTVYMALWDILAYLPCAVIMFIGYLVCGFVVLGPYNVKFSTLAAVVDTLMSSLYGDELYVTIAIHDRNENYHIWLFAHFYIWTYVAIFIVLVLNLLMAIVLSAYEVVKATDDRKENSDLCGAIPKELWVYMNKEELKTWIFHAKW